MQTIKELDSLFSSCFVAMDGITSIDNLLHATTDSASIIERNRAPDIQINIVTIAYRYVDRHLARCKQVVNGLAKHKEQATCISTRTTRRSDIKKLYLLLLVHTIVHTLYLIIYIGRNRAVFDLYA